MNRKWIGIAIAAIAGVLFAILVTDSYVRGYIHYEPLISSFYIFFFLGGFIYTSRIFGELHQPEKSYQYLTLPASTLEKMVSQWLFSAVGFVLVSYILLFIVSLLGAVTASALFDIQFELLNVQNLIFTQNTGIYFVLQSIFFLGACYFRNYNFIKTLLALFIVGFAINLIVSGLLYVIFGQSILSESNFWMQLNDLPLFVETEFPQLVRAVVGYGIAPFFLVVSYFTLKERQV
jgi:hypothetical protein